MRPTPSSVGLDASQPLRRTGGERPGLVLAIVLSLYLAIAVAWLWPVMADPAATRPDIKVQNSLVLADYYLIVWALAWDSHALVTSPLHLFDANTFHPSPKSLAFSEHFLGMVPLFAPTYWATGNPILAANVLVLLTLVLSATAMFLLAWRFTHPAGAFVAGFLYAFSPLSSGVQLMHVHLLGVQYLPLAILFTERWIERARTRDAIGIAICLVLQAATSFYLAYGQMLGYGAYVAVATVHWWGRLDRRRVVGVAAAIAAVGLSMVLLSLPYLALQREGVIPEFGEPGQRPAGLAPAWVNLEIARYLFRLGIGNVGYALAAVAICFVHARDTRYGVCLGLTLTAVGLVAALGPEARLFERSVWTPYRLLADIVPGFSTVRLSPRFLFLAHIGLALLAGIGLGSGIRRLRPEIAWGAAGLAVAAILWTQGGIPRIPIARDLRGVDVPPAVRWLAQNRDGRALLELPPTQYIGAAERMLTSTFHWLPITQGYSAYTTRSDRYLNSIARDLPKIAALRALVNRIDLGWILVHTDELPPQRAAAWRRPLRGLEPIGSFEPDLLFRVVEPVHRDLRGKLFDPDATVHGVPKRPLGPSCPGSIAVKQSPPQPWPPASPLPVRLEIRNDGETPWPGESLAPRHLVRLRVCWGHSCDEETPYLLLRDVPAGGSVEVPILLRTRKAIGRDSLRFRLEQVGDSSLEDCGVAAIEIPVEIARAPAATPPSSTGEAP